MQTMKFRQFNKKYGVKKSSQKTMDAEYRRIYGVLGKSKNPIDVKYSIEIKKAYDIRKKKLPPIGGTPVKPPIKPPPKGNWFRMFKSENPVFSSEYITGNSSTKAEVGYYYQINDFLKNFVANGRFYQMKIPNLARKLATYFSGARYYKNNAGTPIKVILFIEDVMEREVGKTFISLHDFNSNWINWLDSLSIRFQLKDGNYEITYLDTIIKYFRVSTYMKSINFNRERGARFNLRLNYK